MEQKKRFYLVLTLVGITLFFISVLGTKKLYFDQPPSLEKHEKKGQLQPPKDKNISINKTPLKTSPSSEKHSLQLPKLLIYANKELQPKKVPKTPEYDLKKSQSKKNITEKYVSLVLNRQQKDFQRCYENHLRKNPTSKGSMTVHFSIFPQGEIKKVEVKHSTFKDVIFETCIKTVFSRVTLKAFKGPSFEISYPIEFE